MTAKKNKRKKKKKKKRRKKKERKRGGIFNLYDLYYGLVRFEGLTNISLTEGKEMGSKDGKFFILI